MKSFKLFFEQEEQSVAILPGGFKPPTKGHFKALEYILNDASKGIVFIGKKDRDGITSDMSAYIWEIYSKYLSKPIEVKVSDVSPVKSTIDYVESNKGRRVIVGAGDKDEDIKRYNYFIKNIDIFPLVQIVKIPTQEQGISGTKTRELISTDIEKALDYFLPEAVKNNSADRAQIKNILKYK